MKNPSDANGSRDDPTTWRVIDFTHGWGFRASVVVNILPFVASKPAAAMAWRTGGGQGMGPGVGAALVENMTRARAALAGCRFLVAAYGVLDPILTDDLDWFLAEVPFPAARWRCLGLTADGWPKHPLARGRARVPDGAAAQLFTPLWAIDALRAKRASQRGDTGGGLAASLVASALAAPETPQVAAPAAAPMAFPTAAPSRDVEVDPSRGVQVIQFLRRVREP